MPEPKPVIPFEGLRAWAVVGQLGATISFPIIAAVLAAVYFRFQTAGMLALTFIGIVVGGYGAYRIIKPYLG